MQSGRIVFGVSNSPCSLVTYQPPLVESWNTGPSNCRRKPLGPKPHNSRAAGQDIESQTTVSPIIQKAADTAARAERWVMIGFTVAGSFIGPLSVIPGIIFWTNLACMCACVCVCVPKILNPGLPKLVTVSADYQTCKSSTLVSQVQSLEVKTSSKGHGGMYRSGLCGLLSEHQLKGQGFGLNLCQCSQVPTGACIPSRKPPARDIYL